MIEPTAYFDGQRLAAADLTAAQDFHRELRWRHNLALHGAGIVEGLAVDGARGDVVVRVAPGFALDGHGRELILSEPATVPVPPLAGDAPLQLTLRYDEESVEERTGVCSTAGAVRLAERALAALRAPAEVDAELDVVLGSVTVRSCRLAGAPALKGRRTLPKPPRIAAGQTPAGSTPWRSYSSAGAIVGVETTVDTSAARFTQAPIYQARVGGEREVPGKLELIDGPVVIADPTATSFVARMALAGPIPTGGPHQAVVNPNSVRSAAFPARATNELGWHVVWMGVEG